MTVPNDNGRLAAAPLPGRCPTVEQLIRAASGEVPPEERERIAQHASLCRVCGPSWLSAGGPPPSQPPSAWGASAANAQTPHAAGSPWAPKGEASSSWGPATAATKWAPGAAAPSPWAPASSAWPSGQTAASPPVSTNPWQAAAPPVQPAFAGASGPPQIAYVAWVPPQAAAIPEPPPHSGRKVLIIAAVILLAFLGFVATGTWLISKRVSSAAGSAGSSLKAALAKYQGPNSPLGNLGQSLQSLKTMNEQFRAELARPPKLGRGAAASTAMYDLVASEEGVSPMVIRRAPESSFALAVHVPKVSGGKLVLYAPSGQTMWQAPIGTASAVRIAFPPGSLPAGKYSGKAFDINEQPAANYAFELVDAP